MIDRDKLAEQHRAAVRWCLKVSALPLVLIAVCLLNQEPVQRASLLAGTLRPTSMLFDGIIASTSVLQAGLLRVLLHRLPPPQQPLVPTLPRNMPAIASLSMAEYAGWFLAPLMGFVAFMAGAPWVFLLGTLGVGAVGFFISFPRWSTWSVIADKIDARAMAMPHRTSAST